MPKTKPTNPKTTHRHAWEVTRRERNTEHPLVRVCETCGETHRHHRGRWVPAASATTTRRRATVATTDHHQIVDIRSIDLRPGDQFSNGQKVVDTTVFEYCIQTVEEPPTILTAYATEEEAFAALPDYAAESRSVEVEVARGLWIHVEVTNQWGDELSETVHYSKTFPVWAPVTAESEYKLRTFSDESTWISAEGSPWQIVVDRDSLKLILGDLHYHRIPTVDVVGQSDQAIAQVAKDYCETGPLAQAEIEQILLAARRLLAGTPRPRVTVNTSTKISGLSRLNVLALEEVFPDLVETGWLVLTKTTATFTGTAAEAAERVGRKIAELPGRSHPKASLWAVERKLVKLAHAAKEAEVEDDETLLDEVYGVERDEACVHGHLDCAEYEGGPCANETYARKLAEKETGEQVLSRDGGPLSSEAYAYALGIRHDAYLDAVEKSDVRILHRGCANEAALFTFTTSGGEEYVVEVQRRSS